MRAIRVERSGGPEVLEWCETPDPKPAAEELLVRVEAAGVNYVDTYHRSGLYPSDLPYVPGVEGAGVVVAAGKGVSEFAPGDRVAWCEGRGSYAELQAVPAAQAVPVPAGLTTELAAAALLQGVTAHYLVHDTYPLRPGHRCLIHAAAGGVGRLLVQLAKRAGAEVFATAGGPAKCDLARSAGADQVVDYQAENFASALERTAGTQTLDVVYDGVGKATLGKGLPLLKPRGMMVSYGNASGAPDPISLLLLSRLGSLYVTRPSLRNYIATRGELRQRASEVFDLISTGELEVLIGLRLPLAQAAEAHRRLEARETIGKVLLQP